MSSESSSLLEKSLSSAALSDRCLVPQYRTSAQQQRALSSLLQQHSTDALPVEWVVDIADESNGWFYGTVYHYNEKNKTLHVCVPDKENPTFDGQVQLDHRTVHLIECVDGRTDALFNQIVRDSMVKCKWLVDWFEEGAGNERLNNDDEQAVGKWSHTVAKYYFQMTNQIMVEDSQLDDNTQLGFVLLTADLYLRFKQCYKNRGIEDFSRLVYENTVQSTVEAKEEANNYFASFGSNLTNVVEISHPAYKESEQYTQLGDETSSPSYSNLKEGTSFNDSTDYDRIRREKSRSEIDGSKRDTFESRSDSRIISSSRLNSGDGDGIGGDRIPPLRKFSEMSKHLKECLADILEERERKNKSGNLMMNNYMKFVMDGDLDAGWFIMYIFMF
jgi:hypothetical protein